MAVVLITGCSSGIGKVSALAFARNGYHVFAGARNPDDCANLTGIATQESLTLEIVQLDVTDAQAIDAAVTRAIDTCNRIDVLVNNAGVAGLAALEEMPDAVIDRMMQVNFIAPVRLSRAVLPHMRAQGHGRIIMVSSLSALVGLPGEAIYSASKAALEAMAEGLRYEVDRFNISVSVIEPGLFNTALADKMAGRDGVSACFFGDGAVAEGEFHECMNLAALWQLPVLFVCENNQYAMGTALGVVYPPDSPYAPLLQHLQQGVASSAARGDDPLRVAELLVRIAAEENPAFRYPAGDQAGTVTETIIGLDPEARERFIRAVNDTAWWSAGKG